MGVDHAPSFGPKFVVERIVTDDLIDLLGHVNNVQWVAMTVDLAVAHSLHLGFDFERLKSLGGSWVVRKHIVDYLRPAFVGDTLTMETWVTELGAAHSWREYRIVNQHSEECLRAQSQWIFVAENGKPRRIPKIVRASFYL